MKTIKIILLYLMVLFYVGMGVIHLLKPEQYLAMMPSWFPMQTMLIYGSGIIEILLALLLIPKKTRALASRLIIAMLIFYFFAIHIPQSVGFYKTHNSGFIASLIRLPFQFILIGWAWVYAEINSKKSTIN